MYRAAVVMFFGSDSAHTGWFSLRTTSAQCRMYRAAVVMFIGSDSAHTGWFSLRTTSAQCRMYRAAVVMFIGSDSAHTGWFGVRTGGARCPNSAPKLTAKLHLNILLVPLKIFDFGTTALTNVGHLHGGTVDIHYVCFIINFPNIFMSLYTLDSPHSVIKVESLPPYFALNLSPRTLVIVKKFSCMFGYQILVPFRKNTDAQITFSLPI
ncbi:hypothetical protein AXF42_Ash010604 [Apostasia shenzhenica]|uniref:Uncharacterized protein n=1 Tax=Apostasia shenzhenica TaxID=1088818 RepID=A0A2I0A6K0_9ASPA|nr:hypothetical protein AXF42_Ash010604 [Apostasia shenzhenica]